MSSSLLIARIWSIVQTWGFQSNFFLRLSLTHTFQLWIPFSPSCLHIQSIKWVCYKQWRSSKCFQHSTIKMSFFFMIIVYSINNIFFSIFNYFPHRATNHVTCCIGCYCNTMTFALKEKYSNELFVNSWFNKIYELSQWCFWWNCTHRTQKRKFLITF